MKKKREEQIVFDALRDAVCELTAAVRGAVSGGLKQIRIEKHEECIRQKTDKCDETQSRVISSPEAVIAEVVSREIHGVENKEEAPEKKRMTEEQFKEFEHSMIDEFEFALFEFVKRAASEGATAEEVQALPAVARLFKETMLF